MKKIVSWILSMEMLLSFVVLSYHVNLCCLRQWHINN